MPGERWVFCVEHWTKKGENIEHNAKFFVFSNIFHHLIANSSKQTTISQHLKKIVSKMLNIL